MKASTRRYIVPFLFFVTVFAFTASSLASPPEGDSALVGKPSPPFETLDVNGAKVSTVDLFSGGKATIVNFWGLRCGSCLLEIPHLNALYEKHRDRVQFLGVNTDAVTAGVLADQIRKAGIDIRYTVIPDPEFRICDAFSMLAAPLTFVVDPGGIVRYQHMGFEPGDEKGIGEALSKVLGGAAQTAK